MHFFALFGGSYDRIYIIYYIIGIIDNKIYIIIRKPLLD